MKVPFRQGIVSAPNPFLQVAPVTGGNAVNLDSQNKAVTVTFSHGNAEYLYVEPVGVLNQSAWVGPFTATDYWLYWDLDVVTGVRTFGSTLLIPVYQSSAPGSPATDQHWFDTVNKLMQRWTGTRWQTVIRVFSTKLTGGTTLQPMAIGASQAALNSTTNSGRILFDVTAKGLHRPDKTFVTTETQFFAQGSLVNVSKLENNVSTVVSGGSIAAFSVVKFSALNTVTAATSSDAGSTMLALVVDSAGLGDVVDVIFEGVVTNPGWTWTTPGAALYVNDSGVLVTVDPVITNAGLAPRPPVARVLDATTVYFTQGVGGKGDPGTSGAAGVKAACRVASTANIAALSNAGSAIDSVTLAVGNRVLLKNQSTASQNGIYVVQSLSPTVLVRATDADSSGEVVPSMFLFVSEGNTQADTMWTLTTDAPIVLGTTALTFVQFTGGVTVTSGAIVSALGFTPANAATAAPLASPHFTGVPVVPSYAKASLPVGVTGGVIFVTDSTPNPCLAFYNGTAWINVLTGVAVV